MVWNLMSVDEHLPEKIPKVDVETKLRTNYETNEIDNMYVFTEVNPNQMIENLYEKWIGFMSNTSQIPKIPNYPKCAKHKWRRINCHPLDLKLIPIKFEDYQVNK